MNIRPDTTRWVRWFIGNCARNWILTIRVNSICTTQNLPWRMRRTNSSGSFEIQTDHLILARWPDRVIIDKKKRTCRIMDLAVPADHSVKLKKKERKKGKYLDIPRELNKLRNMTVTVIPTVIGALGTVTK